MIESRRFPTAGAWALVVTAGAVAGFTSWLVLELVHDQLQPGLLNTPGMPTPEEASGAARARVAAYSWEATLAFGALGAALGLALGGAGGVLGRSARRALLGALAGAVLGAVAGASVSALLTPLFFRWYNPDADTLILAMAVQGVICAPIGAMAGSSFGIGLGGGRPPILRAAFGGLLGAVLGVLLFQIVAALAFPLDGTSRPISTSSGSRLFARLAVAIVAALGALTSSWPRPARSDS